MFSKKNTGFIWSCGLTIVLLMVTALKAEPIRYRGQESELSVRAAGEHSLRITLRPLDEATASDLLPTGPVLLDRAWPKPVLQIRSIDAQTQTKVGKFQVLVSANPLTMRVSDSDGQSLLEIALDEKTGALSFPCGETPIYGLGEGAKQFDRRGAFYPMRNGSVQGLGLTGVTIPVPLLIGTKGWGLYVLGPWGTFDLKGDRGIFQPQENAKPQIDLLVLDTRQPETFMKEIIDLTGRPVMPPKWVMGYMQSHRTLENDKQMVEIANTFRQKKLPCDALIYLGTGFCPAGWNVKNESFEFNRKVFEREPAEVIRDLHSLNFKVILHVVPPRGQMHGTIPPAAGETLDARHIAEYWKQHLPHMAMGVDGWWPDEGDWLDIPSRFARSQMYYAGSLADRPNVRPWNLQRNGHLGVARYGGWIWSGDVSTNWATLAVHIPVGLNYSLSVSPFWGTDIAGFVPTRELTGELYVRWFQFAAFCPSFRSHGRTWHLRLPWGWNTGETGPNEGRVLPDESELHNPEVEPICRQYMNLRYQLLPYNYTLARQAHDSGMPMMRALWLHYPDDPQAVKEGSEYLWGRDMLIAPVVEKGAKAREVYLPKGDWYDWWTGEKFAGGRSIPREVDLKTLPIYVRAGAIIPLDPVRQYTSEQVTEPTTLQIYSGTNGQFTLYEDDGTSLDYLKNQCTWTRFSWKNGQRRLVIEPVSKGNAMAATQRTFKIRLLPEKIEKKVDYAGQLMEVPF